MTRKTGLVGFAMTPEMLDRDTVKDYDDVLLSEPQLTSVSAA